MPEICRFFGIIITMYFADHPPPHFHVRYGSDRAIFTIDPPGLLEGHLSPRALGLVTDWAALHRQELQVNWDLARRQEPLGRIAPLE